MKTITQRFSSTKGQATLKALVLFFMFAMGSQISYGQLLIEDFDYTNGTRLNTTGWGDHGGSTVNTITVSNSSISYPGYLSSNVGREVTLLVGGMDLNKTFTQQTSGTIYASFLVNVTSATEAGDYFIHLGATTIGNTFRGRVFVKRDASNNLSFGVAHSATPVAYSSATYALNTTYLIVLRYDVVAGTANDKSAIIINPALNTGIPASGWIEDIDASGTDLTNIGSIALRQGGTSVAPGLKLDGIRVSTTWSGIVGTTWDGTAWSNSAPSASVDAFINGAYSTATNGAISTKSLTVNVTTGNLTINTGTNVTVQNAVVNNGTLTIENNANLIQLNNVANSGTGTTTVNRNGSALKRLDYTLWSAPVAAQNLLSFSPRTVAPRFYNYNEGSDKFNVVSNPSGTTFTPGRSFHIRMPDVLPSNPVTSNNYYTGIGAGNTLAYQGVFTGTLNNGNIPVTLTKTSALKGYQAVGNPYPSVIDAQAFVTANTANIENTLYFWRKTNAALGSSYATWTSGGATSVTPSSPTPNGKIQVGQGFIVQAKNAATVSNFFNNTMRDASPSSTQFFKVKQTAQKDRLWLNLTGPNDVFSQALVVYIDDASLGLDNYDGKYINDSDIALTSNVAGNEYTIQGRPAFDATDVVALNFKTSVAGTYKIAIDHADGLFSKGQDIYLVDKKVGVTTNLNDGAYSFTAEAGVDNTRFTLAYQKTLKLDAPLFNENSVLVSRTNGTLNVKSSAVTINNVKVFDIQGRLVAERKNVKSNTASFSNLKANQVLIVKLTSENNAVVTKKVLN